MEVFCDDASLSCSAGSRTMKIGMKSIRSQDVPLFFACFDVLDSVQMDSGSKSIRGENQAQKKPKKRNKALRFQLSTHSDRWRPDPLQKFDF